MKRLITILGPTASGKTRLAVALARSIAKEIDSGAEILSGDSRQVYRRMDIGTGKDLTEYRYQDERGELKQVPYHLIDIAEPGTKYNLFQYQRDFIKELGDIEERGKQPILCGGTGLYIEAVLRGYKLAPVPENPELRKQLEGQSLEALTEKLERLKRQNASTMHNTTDVDTAQRAIRAIEIEEFCLQHPEEALQETADPIPSVVFGVNIDRDMRREKISRRLRERLREGMVDEVRSLLREGIAPEDLTYYGLEYKYVTLFVIGKISEEEMLRSLEIAIHQFAKRQMTWFRGMERRGTKINWIDAPKDAEEMQEAVKKIREIAAV